jgi:hypothetical protein
LTATVEPTHARPHDSSAARELSPSGGGAAGLAALQSGTTTLPCTFGP